MVIAQADLVRMAFELRHQEITGKPLSPAGLLVLAEGMCPSAMRAGWCNPDMRPYIVKASRVIGGGK